MGKISAGLLMYRRRKKTLEVFLIHPGGPFWSKKDLGAWSVPKGEYRADEDPLSAAKREFTEETGLQPGKEFIDLTPAKQAGGKVVRAWAFEGDADPTAITSNTFSMEWPPRSGQHQSFPEVDRAAWFPIEEATQRILKGQVPLLVELQHLLTDRSTAAPHPTLSPLGREDEEGQDEQVGDGH
jgi:predicted NUDIX family NTP pyrophosphohydrolase